jgi:hypothetical protein
MKFARDEHVQRHKEDTMSGDFSRWVKENKVVQIIGIGPNRFGYACGVDGVQALRLVTNRSISYIATFERCCL